MHQSSSGGIIANTIINRNIISRIANAVIIIVINIIIITVVIVIMTALITIQTFLSELNNNKTKLPLFAEKPTRLRERALGPVPGWRCGCGAVRCSSRTAFEAFYSGFDGCSRPLCSRLIQKGIGDKRKKYIVVNCNGRKTDKYVLGTTACFC